MGKQLDQGDRVWRRLGAIILKALLELALLAGIAGYVAWRNFPPSLRGAIDIAGPEQVAGWAIDSGRPEVCVTVQLFIDGQFVASRIASDPRSDLVRAGVTTIASHGFSFSLDAGMVGPGWHRLQVFVLHEALNGYQTLTPLATEEKSFFRDR